MKVVNNTDLDYSTIGLLIDHITKTSHEDTNYYGKVDWYTLIVHNKKIKIQIRYLKKYVEWRFSYE